MFWQRWEMVGLEKISDSRKFLEIQGGQDKSLVMPAQQGQPQQLPEALSFMPRGSCSIWCLAPHCETLRDAKDIGEGEGNGYIVVSSKGCEKNIWNTVGEAFRTTGKGRQVFAGDIASLVPQFTEKNCLRTAFPFSPKKHFCKSNRNGEEGRL